MNKKVKKTAYVIDRFIVVVERLANTKDGCPRFSFDIFPLIANQVSCVTYTGKGHYLNEFEEAKLALEEYLKDNK